MRRRVLLLSRIVLGCLAAGPMAGAADSANLDAEFLRIYGAIQEGESFERAGEAASAAGRYSAARQDLEAFARAHPAWNRKIIKFRLEYLDGKLGVLRGAAASGVPAGVTASSLPLPTPPTALPAGSPASAVPLSRSEVAPAVVVATPAVSPEVLAARERAETAESRLASAEASRAAALARSTEMATQVDQLRDQTAQLALDLRLAREQLEVASLSKTQLEQTRERLESERVNLEARLKEALRPRPAALDPAELAKAEERILLLVKENEILKAGLDWQMAENKRVLEKAGKALELEKELASARSELAHQKRQTDDLRSDRQKLQAKYDALSRKADEQAGALRSDIDELRKELAAAKAAARGGGSGDSGRELAQLRSELAGQKAAAERLRRENEDMAGELEKLTAVRVTPASLKVAEVPALDGGGADVARLRRLERERDELRKDLDAARAELRRSDTAPAQGRVREMSRQVEKLNAKVAALEAKADPYSKEELALFQAPKSEGTGLRLELAQASPPAPASAGNTNKPAGSGVSTPTNQAPATTTAAVTAPASSTNAPAVRRRTMKDLPPGASILASQAERAFRSRRLPDAEQAYREILKLDESNVFTLANLAAILVELNRLEEAETYLKRSLAGDADDAFSLSLLGIIRFRQQKFDEAFEALSRSAALDPESSDTQNYLGITLSQRGQRTAAEAALRKALKLNPNSVSAHFNLSVVYATQKPPFLELARYHYEKARRGGQPANPAFEAVLKGESGGGGKADAPSSVLPKGTP